MKRLGKTKKESNLTIKIEKSYSAFFSFGAQWSVSKDYTKKFRSKRSYRALRDKKFRDCVLRCVSYLRERTGKFRRLILSYVVSSFLQGKEVTVGKFLVSLDNRARLELENEIVSVPKDTFVYGFPNVSDRLKLMANKNPILHKLFSSPLRVTEDLINDKVVVFASPTTYNRRDERNEVRRDRSEEFNRLLQGMGFLSSSDRALLLSGDIEKNPGPINGPRGRGRSHRVFGDRYKNGRSTIVPFFGDNCAICFYRNNKLKFPFKIFSYTFERSHRSTVYNDKVQCDYERCSISLVQHIRVNVGMGNAVLFFDLSQLPCEDRFGVVSDYELYEFQLNIIRSGVGQIEQLSIVKIRSGSTYPVWTLLNEVVTKKTKTFWESKFPGVEDVEESQYKDFKFNRRDPEGNYTPPNVYLFRYEINDVKSVTYNFELVRRFKVMELDYSDKFSSLSFSQDRTEELEAGTSIKWKKTEEVN